MVRGFTLIEVVVAMAVLSLVATGVFVGEEGQLRQVSWSFEELELSRAAASRLEKVTSPEPGERAFETGVEGARGREAVKVLEPGLLEVSVEVARGDHVVRLVTVVATEAAR